MSSRSFLVWDTIIHTFYYIFVRNVQRALHIFCLLIVVVYYFISRCSLVHFFLVNPIHSSYDLNQPVVPFHVFPALFSRCYLHIFCHFLSSFAYKGSIRRYVPFLGVNKVEMVCTFWPCCEFQPMTAVTDCFAKTNNFQNVQYKSTMIVCTRGGFVTPLFLRSHPSTSTNLWTLSIQSLPIRVQDDCPIRALFPFIVNSSTTVLRV